MANTAIIYTIHEAEFLAHQVRIWYQKLSVGWFRTKTYRRAEPAAPEPAPNTLPLLDWINSELADSVNGETIVGSYLLEYEPGVCYVGYFRPEGGLEADLDILTRGLPDLRRRLGIIEYSDDTEHSDDDYWMQGYLTDSSMTTSRMAFFAQHPSPLAPLAQLHGVVFLAPADIEALSQVYTSTPPDRLFLADDPDAWDAVFDAHRTQPYDLAFMRFSGKSSF